jgi:hypothetical protein
LNLEILKEVDKITVSLIFHRSSGKYDGKDATSHFLFQSEYYSYLLLPQNWRKNQMAVHQIISNNILIRVGFY